MLYPLIKSLLFTMEPERAHELALHVAQLNPSLGKLGARNHCPELMTKVGNCLWHFPVGLAAGLDKNAQALSYFENQGFGALECGTITLRPQDGNPKPRVWRYPAEESLRNAMGFPNGGLKLALSHLGQKEVTIPIGANIGKNKESTPEESIEELALLLEALYEEVDYFTINVSSPNTPGLRALQERSYLSELFTELNQHRKGKDLYLKIAPDLQEDKVIELTRLANEYKLTGIIATNTTIMPERGPGGVSGKLLLDRSRQVREWVLRENTALEVIGVGGFSGPADVFDFWKQGGKAVQIYTAYVYQGPSLLKNIQRHVERMLKNSGLRNLEEFFMLSVTDRKKLLS